MSNKFKATTLTKVKDELSSEKNDKKYLLSLFEKFFSDACLMWL